MNLLDIKFVLQLVENGTFLLHLLHFLPVRWLKVLVRFYLLNVRTFLRVLLQNRLAQVDRVFVLQFSVPGGRAVEDLALEHIPVVGDEGWIACHEFLYKATDIPDVEPERVLVALDHLRWQLL